MLNHQRNNSLKRFKLQTLEFRVNPSQSFTRIFSKCGSKYLHIDVKLKKKNTQEFFLLSYIKSELKFPILGQLRLAELFSFV